jgi:hypothetical protein
MATEAVVMPSPLGGAQLVYSLTAPVKAET